LREGKIIATESDEPVGDFNIRLAPGRGEICSNPAGGLNLMGEPPLSKYDKHPQEGYTANNLYGEISNQVYSVLLKVGGKSMVFLDWLELEDAENLRTIITWGK